MEGELRDVWTVGEVASYLRTTVRTVRGLIRRKEIKALRVGREYRITREALEEYLKGKESQ